MTGMRIKNDGISPVAWPRNPQFACRRGGQILAIVLMAITLLVGLIFYVYNVGDVVNRRLSMQNAADSVAIGGGTWLARSMNIIASNNVNQARMLALVPVMDALPMASKMAFHEMDDWVGDTGTRTKRASESGLAKEVEVVQALMNKSAGTEKQEYSLLLTELAQLKAAFIQQRAILDTFDLQLNGDETTGVKPTLDMTSVTYWNGRGVGQGSIWRGLAALDDFSQATKDSGGLLAQWDAVRFGQANHADVAFMAPIAPVIPGKHGNFMDFQPVLQGVQKVDSSSVQVTAGNGEGGAIPDAAYPYRLGPWARLFPRPPSVVDYYSQPFAIGWRNATIKVLTWKQGPVVEATIRNGSKGSINLGGSGTGLLVGTWGSGGLVPDKADIEGYTTFGPFSWAVGRPGMHPRTAGFGVGGVVGLYCQNNLPDSFFGTYLKTQADAKLDYMFGPKSPLIKMHSPEWIMDYPSAKTAATMAGARVTWTMFHELQIASKYRETDAGYLTPGTFRTVKDRPPVVWCPGWLDPGVWPGKVGDYIWKDLSTVETTGDSGIGLPPKTGPDGKLVWQPVYVYTWYVFAGIDVGGDTNIENPCNWGSGETLPAPVLLDTTIGDYSADSDAGPRREHFTCLGIAKKNDGATVWPQKFASLSPTNSMFIMAQVKVFNDASWDLWTQNWRAQLTPVTQWHDWYSQLQAGQADVGSTAGKVNGADVTALMTFMKNLESGSAGAPDAGLVH